MKSKDTYMQENLTEDEFNRLLNELGFGSAMDPKLLEIAKTSNENNEAYEVELELVEEWQLQDELKEFNELIVHKNKPKDLDFMCEVPSSCKSFLNFGSNCSCIRKNFESPSDFEDWAKDYINRTTDKN